MLKICNKNLYKDLIITHVIFGNFNQNVFYTVMMKSLLMNMANSQKMLTGYLFKTTNIYTIILITIYECKTLIYVCVLLFYINTQIYSHSLTTFTYL